MCFNIVLEFCPCTVDSTHEYKEVLNCTKRWFLEQRRIDISSPRPGGNYQSSLFLKKLVAY